MAWTAPATAVANTFLTAAFWNTQVRDNLLETAPAKAAVAGDTFYATAANAIARLPAGANGSLSQMAAGIPSWLAPVAYRMPRGNAAGNLMEYVASLNLAKAPVYARSAAPVNLGANPTLASIVTQSYTNVGGLCLVWWWMQTKEDKAGSAEVRHYGKPSYASVAIGDQLEIRGFSNGASQQWNGLSGFVAHTPGAGTQNYTVDGMYLSATTSGTPTAVAQLLIVELAP